MKKLLLMILCIMSLYSLDAQTTLKSVFGENVSPKIQCDAPEGLYGEYTYNDDGTFGATLNLFQDTSEWLYYDNGTFASALGFVDANTGLPGTIYWAVMFPAEMLSQYAGYELTMLSMYFYENHAGVFSIHTGGDDVPGTMVHSQTYDVSDVDMFVDLKLDKAVEISGTENIWVRFYNTTGSMVAAYSLDSGDPNGRWLSNDGNTWVDIADVNDPGWYGTWMVRACVENPSKTEMATLDPTSTLDHYNIYRSTTNDNYELVGETTEMPYFDELTEEGSYYYQLTAVYTENGEECESDPATAYEDPTQDYIMVDVLSVEEKGVEGLMIYPNPTRDYVNVTAESMTHITVTNALGQVMYERIATSDHEFINMSQYEAGIYMLRITTESGVAVQRVVVK